MHYLQGVLHVIQWMVYLLTSLVKVIRCHPLNLIIAPWLNLIFIFIAQENVHDDISVLVPIFTASVNRISDRGRRVHAPINQIHVLNVNRREGKRDRCRWQDCLDAFLRAHRLVKDHHLACHLVYTQYWETSLCRLIPESFCKDIANGALAANWWLKECANVGWLVPYHHLIGGLPFK